jgi:hypothetical protein
VTACLEGGGEPEGKALPGGALKMRKRRKMEEEGGHISALLRKVSGKRNLTSFVYVSRLLVEISAGQENMC